jgi:hypothetical protein
MKNTTQLHLEKRITTMAIVYAHGNVMIYAGYNLKELQQICNKEQAYFSIMDLTKMSLSLCRKQLNRSLN